MSSSFCITVRFLQPMYHGRGDGGDPEWPPSPLRVFQALVAASGAHWNERLRVEYAAPALRWLERQSSPSIVAAVGLRSQAKYRLYVPDNVGDKIAGSWSRGGDASIAGYRTEKDVCPIHLLDGDAVCFIWPLRDSDPDFRNHEEVLLTAARSITHLGWGIDMVAANATIISAAEAAELPGERWLPVDDSSAHGSRVPMAGTLDALAIRHEAFLNRLDKGVFNPVPPLSAFRVVGYRRATDPAQLPFAAFSILRPDARGFRPFDTARRGMVVAAMMRHAAGSKMVVSAIRWAAEWTPERIAAFTLGHGEQPGQPHLPVQGARLAYLPLPSLESRGDGRVQVLGSIRRALVTVFGGQAEDELQQLARLLPGVDLINEGAGTVVALLSRIPNSDRMVRRYTDPATTWATVTPVVLPGYDDPRKYRRRLFPKLGVEGPLLNGLEQKELLAKLDKRIDYLLRKAIRQAGFSDDLARNAEIQWRKVGFWPGTELATLYAIPNKLRRFRRLHVRITWRDASGNPMPITGPICVGRGRFVGLGLFAAE